MADEKKNFFEKLGIFIPGYKGYAEREGRRETDKLLRDKLAQTLSHEKNVLDEIMLTLTSSQRLSVLNEVDRAKKKLEKVVDRLKFASYGASGFFDVVQIKEGELDKLYQFDLSLAESVSQIGADIENTKKALSKTDDEIKQTANRLSDMLNEFNKKLDSRKQCILEVK